MRRYRRLTDSEGDAVVMSGLFALVAVTMGLVLANRPRAAAVLFLVTLVLVALTFRYHATDTLAISL